MMPRAMIAGVLAALALASPGWAKDDDEKWETKVVADKPLFALNPDKAYILVQADAMVVPYFMRVANAVEAAGYAQRRAEALAKEHAKWERKHAFWVKSIEGLKGSPSSVARPTEPLEPTEANFGWPRYEMAHPVAIGPQNRFSKQNGSVYLQEVPPGEYVYYGNFSPIGGGGACACLGTASFAAPAGKVVAMRIRLPYLEALQAAPKGKKPKDSLDLPVGSTTLRLESASSSDPRIPKDAVIPAEFRAAGQLPNAFGIEVERVMPIDGAFAYEQDRQIDLRKSPPGGPEPASK